MVVFIVLLFSVLIAILSSIAQGENWKIAQDSSQCATFKNYHQEHECTRTDSYNDKVSLNNENSLFVQGAENEKHNTYHDQFCHPKKIESKSSSPTGNSEDTIIRAKHIISHQTLPEGWEEFFDPQSGKPYYYNVINSITTWTRPVLSESPNERVSSLHPDFNCSSIGGQILPTECYQSNKSLEVESINADISYNRLKLQNSDTFETLLPNNTKEEHSAESKMIREISNRITFDGTLEKNYKTRNDSTDTEYSDSRRDQTQSPLIQTFDHKNISQNGHGSHSQLSISQKSPELWESCIQTQRHVLQSMDLNNNGHSIQSLITSMGMKPPISQEKRNQIRSVENYNSQQPINQKYCFSSPNKHISHLYQPSKKQKPSGLYSRQYQGQYGYGRVGGIIPYKLNSIQYQEPQRQLGQINSQGQTMTLVNQSTSTVKDALGSAWQGVLGFSNRTKAVVGQARDSVVYGASQVGQSVTTTSFGIWGRAKESVENIGKSMFESSNKDKQTASDDPHVISGYHISSHCEHRSQFSFPPQDRSYFNPTYTKTGSNDTPRYSPENILPKKSNFASLPISGNLALSETQRGIPLSSRRYPTLHEGKYKPLPNTSCYGYEGNKYPDRSEWHPSSSRSIASQKDHQYESIPGINPKYYPGSS